MGPFSSRSLRGLALMLAVLAVPACGGLSPDAPPAAYSLTGTWKLNAAQSTDTQKALQSLNPRHEVSAPDPYVLPDPNPLPGRDFQRRPLYRPPLDIQLTELRGGEWLEIEQKPDEIIITNGARVRSFTPGQKSVVSVPSGVADQKSGWNGRQYVVEIRPQLGPSSQERYRLSDDGKRLFVTIRVAGEGRNRSLTVERVYDRVSALPHALPGSD